MLDIPEDICKKLICSNCKKYLSVLPIKVYPNREVKCGRCCKDGDGGTVSTLYQTVTQNVLFPCIYRKEGCRELLLTSKMKEHELKCSTFRISYCCPLCYKHSADSYNLSLHIDVLHKNIMLKDADFVLCFEGNDELQKKDFFYQGDDTLLYMSLSYNSKLVRFEPHIVGNNEAFIQFSLLSLDNKLLKHTDRVKCSQWNNNLDPILINLDIRDITFPNNVVFCKFHVIREPVSVLPFERCLVDDQSVRALLKYTFKNIHALPLDKHIFSDDLYHLKNLPWQMCISRTTNNLAFIKVLIVLCCKEGLSSCNAQYNLSLRSSKKNYVKAQTSVSDVFKPGSAWGYDNFISWWDLTHPEYGFIVNDTITIEAELTITSISYNEHGCQSIPKRPRLLSS